MSLKQIIGLGGGGFTMEENPLLDLYILGSCKKNNPQICLLPTASGDNIGLINYFESYFQNYGCKTKCLNLIFPETNDMEDYLLNNDIIYVSGGNSKSMLGLWKEWGVDKILKKAYDQGIVLAGVSAGFVCWFEQCVTDSYPGKITDMPALGILNGSGCPHYEVNGKRSKAYRNLLSNGKISPGYAAEDCVALHFINGKMTRAVSSQQDGNAYYVSSSFEEKITPEYLLDNSYYNKYIQPVIENIKQYKSSLLNNINYKQNYFNEDDFTKNFE